MHPTLKIRILALIFLVAAVVGILAGSLNIGFVLSQVFKNGEKAVLLPRFFLALFGISVGVLDIIISRGLLKLKKSAYVAAFSYVSKP